MRRVAIVQARMTSTRLPGKVLELIGDRPLLAYELDRLRRARHVDEIVIATTTNTDDDPIQALAEREDVRWFRGSEHDVLERFVGAAREAAADLVVRLTADCPLLDPDVTDQVIALAEAATHEVDYVSNVVRRTYPRGLDTEVVRRDTLERVARIATSQPAREHVTYFITTENPDLFVIRGVEQDTNDSDLRWTVDTADDLALVRELHRLAGPMATLRELVTLVRDRPDLTALNRHVEQKKL
jgi:spore coat polysaccharide biosynthesis protein SpsF